MHIPFGSCSSDAIKEKINKAGDIAGQATGEFAEGIAKGVEKAFDVKLELSAEIKSKGLDLGKCTIRSDSTGNENILVVYLIFSQDYNGPLTVKAYDSKLKEMGRVRLNVEGKKDESQFVEFRFDKRTQIDNNSKLTME